MVSLIKKYQNELVQLCRKHHVRKLDVFGSAATGEFGATSDIDFLVEFDDKANERRFDNYFDLHRALEQLYARPVDLIEPGGLRNPFFIRRVNETRKQVYASS